jgi:outer membrane receptor protein involved in Fe transport
LTINNLFDRAPPTDYSISPSPALPPPYFNVVAYNGLKRLYWLEMRFHF